MPIRPRIFLENRAWVQEQLDIDPSYFNTHTTGQTPHYLWIGCSDSRVLPNEITGTNVGDMFVHRNIANLVINDDKNLMSVITYAVKYLKIKNIIVCGHYGCGGVVGAMSKESFGYLDGWLGEIKKTLSYHKAELDLLSPTEQIEKAVELNVIQQVHNLKDCTVMRNLSEEFPDISLYGWVYDLKTGLLKDLDPLRKV